MSLKLRHPDDAYYAKQSAPTFNQLGGSSANRIHFTDKEGRQYVLARKERQVFMNRNMQFKRSAGGTRSRRVLVIDNRGLIKLYVKLTHQSRWFGARDMNKPLALTVAHDERGVARELTCILKRTDKPDPRRATGAIFVKGLDPLLCQELIEEDGVV